MFEDAAADVGFRIGAEVHEESELQARRFEVVHQLGLMLRMKRLHGFELDDDLTVADQIRLIEPAVAALVEDMQRLLRLKRNAPNPQLLFERILIDLFKMPTAERLVDLVDRTAYRIGLVFIKQLLVHGGKYTTPDTRLQSPASWR